MTEEQKEEETEDLPPIKTPDDELKECKDKYLRLLAETENARKRMYKEKQDSVRYAVDNVFSDILTPLDNLENALSAAQNMTGEVKQWAMGFQMILTQFKDVLSQNGVTSFSSEGKAFDPHLHEAVEAEETDHVPEGTILREFIRGYKSKDNILRPARVKVAKPIPTNKEQEQKE